MSSVGWSRAAWGDGGWGEDTNQILYLSGWGRLEGFGEGAWGQTDYSLAATGQVGTVAAGIIAGATVNVTGVEATGVIGTANVQGKGEVFPSSRSYHCRWVGYSTSQRCGYGYWLICYR